MVSPYLNPSLTPVNRDAERERAQARAAGAAANAKPAAVVATPADRAREQAQARAAAAAQAAQVRATAAAAPAAAGSTTTIYNNGSTGGAAAAPLAAAPVAAPAFDENYVKNNFLYGSAEQENQRLLQDFDASTIQGRQQVGADQLARKADLGDRLTELGIGNAESMASRGLLRSGLTFQAQDKIDREGVKQTNVIDGLATDYDSKRAQARIQQEAANRANSQKAIDAILQAYAAQYGVSGAA